MFLHERRAVQTHDLLQVRPQCVLDEGISCGDSVPRWVEERLHAVPFAVVRRGPVRETLLPIGIRGPERNQRWAAFCSPHAILRVIAPYQLSGRAVTPSRAKELPAMQALEILQARWAGLDCAWGPGGSVGFELATGVKTATPGSDLDIVLWAATPLTAERAKLLCAQATGLPAAVDIRVETPVCGFSLREYAREERGEILLRMTTGHVLGSDPWRQGPCVPDVTSGVARGRSGWA